MTDVVALAKSLARPVTQGFLPLNQAAAAIAVACARAAREGTLGGNGDAADAIHITTHILQLHIERLEGERAKIVEAIARRIRPLLYKHESKGRIRAEAHDANGEFDFSFTEPEVEQVIIRELLSVRARVRRKAGPQPAPSRARPRRYHGR